MNDWFTIEKIDNTTFAISEYIKDIEMNIFYINI